METRASNSRILSNSTFKPPPRVTLTDQKREAWLRDLATPSVPLRRLSRTIPHGIRNKSLLDQCCNKSIPIDRAAWFARCVGANELRGLKRKGSNVSLSVSETIWVQDWTKEVCDYIERMVKELEKVQADKLKWRSKMEYMTRLTAYFYHEELVDRSSILRWVVKYLHNCPMPEIPMALVFAKLFWNDLVRSRRPLGQLLARALLHRYSTSQLALTTITTTNTTTAKDLSVFTSIVDSLHLLIHKLFMISSDFFIMPKWWSSLGPVLLKTLSNTSDEVDKTLMMIRLRNEALTISDTSSKKAMRNHRNIVVKLLDQFKAPFNYEVLAKSFCQTSLTPYECLLCIFEWSCTINRSGWDRIYVATAITKYLNIKLEWDIEGPFLDFLVNITDTTNLCMANLYILVNCFLENELFYVGDYFRKLISLGILFLKRLQPRIQSQILILQNLNLEPCGVLSNQCEMLLRGADKLPLDKFDNMQNAKGILENKLSFLLSSPGEYMDTDDSSGSGGGSDLSPFEKACFSKLLTGQAISLSRWIVDTVESCIDHNSIPSFSQFGVIQRCLEELGDIDALSKVVRLLVPKISSGQYLYSLTNTVVYYTQAFAALGNLTDLIEQFILAFNSLKIKVKLSQGLWDLIQLVMPELEKYPSGKIEIDQLLKFTNSLSPPAEITNLSPISESQFPESSIATTDFWMEQLGSLPGEGFDSSYLTKYFGPVSSKMVQYSTMTDVDELRTQARLLQHLRELDPNRFEELFGFWLREQVEPMLTYDMTSFVRLLLFIIIYDCATLGKIADFFMQLKTVGNLPDSNQHSKLMLYLVCGELENFGLLACERLVLDLYRRQFEEQHWKVFLRFLDQEVHNFSQLDEPIVSAHWIGGVRRFLLAQINTNVEQVSLLLVDPALANKDVKKLNKLQDLLNHLLVTQGMTQTLDQRIQGSDIEIDTLTHAFSCLNLPLCQLAAKVVIGLYVVGMSGDELKERILKCVTSFSYRAESLGLSKAFFGDILALLDRETKGNILFQSELCFLQSSNFPLVRMRLDSNSSDLNVLLSLVEIADSVADSAVKNVCETNGTDVVDCLDRLIVLCDKPETKLLDSYDQPSFSNDDLKNAVLFLIKIIVINCQTSFAGSESLKEKMITRLYMLRDTQLVSSVPDIYGLLIDVLDNIKEESTSVDQLSTTLHPMNGHRKTNSFNARLGSSLSPGLTTDSTMASSSANDEIPNPESYLRNLMIYDKSTNSYSDIKIRAFNLLEEGNPTMTANDVPLNLSLFDSLVEKTNSC